MPNLNTNPNLGSVIPGNPSGSTSTGSSIGTGTSTSTSSGTQTSGPNLSAINPTLTASINQFLQGLNISNQQAANAAQVPNDPALEQQSSTDIAAALSGQLPPDVVALLSQQGAERGVSIGSPGAGNSTSSLLQSLGLSSLNLENTGEGWLSQADARNPAAPVINAASYIPTIGTNNNTSSGTTNNAGQTAGTNTGPSSSGSGGGGDPLAGYGGYGGYGSNPLAGFGNPTPAAQSGSGTVPIQPYVNNNPSILSVPNQTQVDDLNAGLGPVSAGYNPYGTLAPAQQPGGVMNPTMGALDTSPTDIFSTLNLGGSLPGIDPSLYTSTDVTQDPSTAPPFNPSSIPPFDPTGGFDILGGDFGGGDDGGDDGGDGG